MQDSIQDVCIHSGLPAMDDAHGCTDSTQHPKLSGKAQQERYSGATLVMQSMPLSSLCQCGMDCKKSLSGHLIANVQSAAFSTRIGSRLCQHSIHHKAPALGLSPGIHYTVILACSPVLECRWVRPICKTFLLVWSARMPTCYLVAGTLKSEADSLTW